MAGWLHFLNLQYWYCIIYSAFGGHCTYLDQLRAAEAAAKAAAKASAGSAAHLTFWQSVAHNFAHEFSFLGSLFGHGAVSTSTSSGLVPITLPPFVVTALHALGWLWHTYSALAYTVSGFLALSILSALAGLAFIRFREMRMYGTLPPAVAEVNATKVQWQSLLDDALSSEPKCWKSAILAADMMLGELLSKLGYTGINTGERMQRLTDDAFATVPQAWEAHRVKNFISSGSSNFVLTQRDAYRVMKLYEQVFEEHRLI